MNQYIITLYYHNELQPITQKVTGINYANAINNALNNSKKQQKVNRIDIMRLSL